MRVKIDLISDVHATAAPLREALAHFRREEVDTIRLCLGHGRIWQSVGFAESRFNIRWGIEKRRG